MRIAEGRKTRDWLRRGLDERKRRQVAKRGGRDVGREWGEWGKRGQHRTSGRGQTERGARMRGSRRLIRRESGMGGRGRQRPDAVTWRCPSARDIGRLLENPGEANAPTSIRARVAQRGPWLAVSRRCWQQWTKRREHGERLFWRIERRREMAGNGLCLQDGLQARQERRRRRART